MSCSEGKLSRCDMKTVAQYCEITYNVRKDIPAVELPESMRTQRQSILELYQMIRAAKNKAECGAALRQFVPWNDPPRDVWDKLEDMFPLNKTTKF